MLKARDSLLTQTNFEANTTEAYLCEEADFLSFFIREGKMATDEEQVVTGMNAGQRGEMIEGSPAHTFGHNIEELMDIFKEDLIDWVGEVLSSSPLFPEPLLVLSSSTASPHPPSLLLNQPVPQPCLCWCLSVPQLTLSLSHLGTLICLGTSRLQLDLGVRPPVSVLAPSSLVASHRTSSTRLPRPSSSTLFSHRPSAASGSHSSFASSHSPSGSVRLLCRSGSTVAFQFPGLELVVVLMFIS
ncbi:DNA adenine methyltransferase YhdJ [Labeo rohita]|uniref:DNA adenine methyltransferase YhdJ n=1 Tax=Labeo rohita TaxID=84645 RepID=A0ABQ8MEY2_LABRO|nr:DNA adenine methyltransferase YhdJ [Labeo rohita]